MIMTSNLGACEMSSLVEGGIGFGAKPKTLDVGFDDKMSRTAVEAARDGSLHPSS
jgi:hypothetical protein